MLSDTLVKYLKQESTIDDFESWAKIVANPLFDNEMKKARQNGYDVDFANELSQILDSIDLYKACSISWFLGFVCEKTNDTSNGKYIIPLLAKVLKLLEQFCLANTNENEEIIIPNNIKSTYKENKEFIKAYFGCEMLCVSSMAFLSRNFNCRNILRSFDMNDTLEYLVNETPEDSHFKSIYYVNRVYNTCGKLPLIVLDIANRQGFIAEANDLDNCFHLIFLLEDAIHRNLCDKYGMNNLVIDNDLLKLARGEYPNCGDKSYITFFTELNCYALTSNDNKQILNNLIWGEMPPEYIPRINGYSIILLYPQKISRSFCAGFLSVAHTSLRPYVNIINELTTEEFNLIEEKIKSTIYKS